MRNTRFIITGLGLVVLAALFFAVMLGMAPKSNDPAAMMATVGEASGVVGAIGLAMAVLGLIGKKSS
ncbi:MAG TPA: hypothetical protein VGF56_04910 [Rhizomicrobium sp.]|jgi:hypothetical protein